MCLIGDSKIFVKNFLFGVIFELFSWRGKMILYLLIDNWCDLTIKPLSAGVIWSVGLDICKQNLATYWTG